MSKRKSFYVVIGLLAILLVLAVFSINNTNTFSNDNIAEMSLYENGTTVFAGDTIVNSNKCQKFPLAINLKYLVGQIKEGEIGGAFISIITGVVPTPSSEIVAGNVTTAGKVDDFEGPGYVEIKDNKLFVHSPGEYVWGYNDVYTVAVKTNDGIDIVNVRQNKTIKHLSSSEINNETIDKKYLPKGDQLSYWNNLSTVHVGNQYILEYAVAGINDGRHYISPDELREHFPEAYKYSCKYPGGSPVILYSNHVQEKVVSETYTYLGSHPQYNDANRAYNAKQFVKAWNGTIIPAHSVGCGREGVAFSAVKEEAADSGYATHGVCPPARTLRNSVLQLGLALPIGMDSGEDAVLFGFNPSTGIKITNTLDYPIKIKMWTEGEGTGMAIHSQIIGLYSRNYQHSPDDN